MMQQDCTKCQAAPNESYSFLVKVLLKLDFRTKCNSKRSQTITRNMPYKIKNTAIKAKTLVTKTHTITQKAIRNKQ